MVWFTKRCRCEARLDGKTVVVTGSNAGIGRATAKELADRGARVILAVRDVSRGEQAAVDIRSELQKRRRKHGADKDPGVIGEVVVQRLDLASLRSVRECARQLLDTEPAIHILVNNAAVMCTPRTLTEDGFEEQFGVNHLGHFLFTILLLPRLRSSAPSRIVVVGSASYAIARLNFDDLMGEKNYSKFGAYSQSKLANLLFLRELTRRLKEAGIEGVTTYCPHPGYLVATDISRHFDSFLVPGTKFFVDKVGKYFVRTPKQGAQTVIHCAVSPKLANETGLYYGKCRIEEPAPCGKDDMAALELWSRSLQLCGCGEEAAAAFPTPTPKDHDGDPHWGHTNATSEMTRI